MAIRYRTIAKILCENCAAQSRLKQKIDTRCGNCQFLKYNNVQDLISYTKSLYKNYPNWVYFHVYQYIKGSRGPYLDNFIKGKKEPSNKTLE